MIELWEGNSVGVEVRNTYTRGAEASEVNECNSEMMYEWNN